MEVNISNVCRVRACIRFLAWRSIRSDAKNANQNCPVDTRVKCTVEDVNENATAKALTIALTHHCVRYWSISFKFS